MTAETPPPEEEAPDVRVFVVSAAEAGRRLDAALAEAFPDLSRNRVQSLIEGGQVALFRADDACFSAAGGRKIAAADPSRVVFEKSQRIQEGDRIQISVKQKPPLHAEPEAIGLDIVYEDADIVVVNKPRGFVVHPAAGHASGTLVNALLYHGELAGGDNEARPGVVQRIDKDTSGLLVFAKNEAAHAGLAAQFAAHTVRRLYQAIACGGFAEDAGMVDAPLARKPNDRKARAVVPGGKRAVTHWRVLERFGERRGVCGITGANAFGGKFTLLELRLETGRTHQIRVHMAYIGRPLLGDGLYGRSGGTGQYLHAKTLGFLHPVSGIPMEFDSELPAYFQEMLEKLRSAEARVSSVSGDV